VVNHPSCPNTWKARDNEKQQRRLKQSFNHPLIFLSSLNSLIPFGHALRSTTTKAVFFLTITDLTFDRLTINSSMVCHIADIASTSSLISTLTALQDAAPALPGRGNSNKD
jgi:hypothetical protein